MVGQPYIATGRAGYSDWSRSTVAALSSSDLGACTRAVKATTIFLSPNSMTMR